VESNDVGEEGTRCHCRGVGMGKGNEMGVFGELIHHCENHRFTANLGETLNEIHDDINPHREWHLKELQQASRVEVLCFVPLAHHASVHEV
jgi:hypothetical protein